MQTSQSTWEYKEFVYAWERKHRYWVTINRWGNEILSEPQYRLSLWQNLQSELMPEIQKWFDDGWEPVTEVGPASLKIRTGTGYAKGYKPVGKFIFTTLCILLLPIGWAVMLLALADYAEVTEAKVQIRRRRKN